MFTIVSPSKSPVKLQLSFSQWGRALSDLGTSDFPAIPVVGADNIARGYNAALEKVTTEFVIFSHDDAYPLTYPPYKLGKRLAERMQNTDVLGFCGSDKFCGASWQTSGALFGQVVNHPPLPEQMDQGALMQFQTGMRPCGVALWQRPARLLRGIRVADGYCIVARTEALKKINGFWVPPSCPHFHFYDLDLFLTAFEAGLRTAVATDIYITHNSHGSYQQDQWVGGLKDFMDKWGGKADPTYGLGVVHRTIQANDARVAYLKLVEEEKFMSDELTLREHNAAQ